MKYLKSRTLWTVVLMFIVGGTEALVDVIPAEVHTITMLILGMLATYFKLNPSQDY